MLTPYCINYNSYGVASPLFPQILVWKHIRKEPTMGADLLIVFIPFAVVFSAYFPIGDSAISHVLNKFDAPRK